MQIRLVLTIVITLLAGCEFGIHDGPTGQTNSSLESTSTDNPESPAEVGNTPPIAVDDQVTFSGAGPVEANVLANDRDADGDTLLLTGVSVVDAGTLSINDNATPGDSGDDYLVFVPTGAFDGSAQATYTVTDGRGGESTAQATFLAEGDGILRATDDRGKTGSNLPLVLPVLANDTVPAGAVLSIVSPPSNGSVAIDQASTPTDPADDRIVYSPNSGFVGFDSFLYSLSTDTDSVAASVNIFVGDASPATETVGGRVGWGPVAGARVALFSVDEFGQAMGSVPLYQAITDDEGYWQIDVAMPRSDLLVVASGGAYYDELDSRSVEAGRRLFDLTANSRLESVLRADENRLASTIYSNAALARARLQSTTGDFDRHFLSSEQIFSQVLGWDPRLTPFTDPAQPDGTRPEQERQYAMVLGGLANVRSRLAANLGLSLSDPRLSDAVILDLTDCRLDGIGLAGPVSVMIDGALRFLPTNQNQNLEIYRFVNNNVVNYFGTELVEVDESACAQQTVLAQALDDTVSTSEDTPVTVAVLANDLRTGSTTITLTTPPTNASVTLLGTSLVYQPDADFYGVDSFEYTIQDVTGATSAATVTVTVDPVNDAPAIIGQRPISMAEDQAYAVSSTDLLVIDPDDVYPGLFSLSVLPGAGYALSGNIVTPTPNFFGQLTVVVQVEDPNGLASAPAELYLDVYGVNDPPQRENAIGDQNILPNSAFSLDVAANFSDVDGESLAYSVTGLPNGLSVDADGVISGTVLPATAGLQPYNVQVTATDAIGAEAVDAFLLSVILTNSPPTVSSIADQSFAEGSSSGSIGFTIGDPETAASSLLVNASTDNPTLFPPGAITLSGANASRAITLVPAGQAFGTATVTVAVGDGNLSTQTSFTVSVAEVNDRPIITAQSDLATPEDEPLTLTPAALVVTDADDPYPAGFELNLGLGSNYSVSGTTVIPDAEFNGDLTVTVTVTDPGGAVSDPFAVLISVLPESDVPVIADQIPLQTLEDQSLEIRLTDLVVIDNDDDYPTGFVLSVFAGTDYAVSGTTITPSPGYSGPLGVGVAVADPGGEASAVYNVSVDVVPVDDAPVISVVGNVNMLRDTGAGPIDFTVADADTPLSELIVEASSSDESIIANAGITVSGSGAVRSLWLTPVAGAVGDTTISLEVSDAGNTATETFAVTVATMNTPPTVTTVLNQSISEDSALGAVSFEVGDAETSAGSLIVTAASSDQTVVADADIVLGGSGSNRSVSLTPVSNASGSATITLTVSDVVSQVTETFDVLVSALNDRPTITAVADQGINEDVALAPVGFTIGDLETAPAALIVTAVSSDQSVVADADISLGGSGAGRTIALTPVADANGTATITLTVSDGVDQDTEVFNVAVAVVNDVPTITAVVDQGISEDGALAPVGFTIGDVETAPAALVVTAVSSDQSVIADAGITLGGSGASRTLALTPVADANGTATITLTVSDGVDQDTEIFTVTVTAVNDMPTITAVADQGINEDVALAPVGFTIGDLETAPAALIVTAVSSDQSVVADADISLGGSGAGRTIALTPVADANGTATITLTVSDGVDQDTEVFNVAVAAVNDVPTITAVVDQGISEDGALAPVGFTIGDVETAPAALVVTAVSSDQSVIADAGITLGGSGASRTLALTPVADANGTATITLTVSDGVDQDTEIFTVTVTAVNDMPTITAVADQGINEDVALAPVGFTIGDLETAPAALIVTAVSSDQSVVADADISLGGSGAGRTIALTPVADANGTATITLTVSDGVDQDTEVFNVAVAAVNDVPTITAVVDQGISEDGALAPVGFTIGDVETAPAALVVTAVSSDQSVIADAGITLGGSGASRTLALTPVADANGTATITLTVSDGVDQDTEIFTVTVTAVNDMPTITAVADQGINEDVALAPVGFTIGDLETAPAALIVTAVSSDQSVVADADISLGGSGAGRTIALTPVADANGTATITLTVSDGVDQDTEVFNVAVAAVNDVPTITAVVDQGISEDGALAPVGFTIGDVETAPAALVVTAVSSDQSVIADAGITLGGSGASRTLALTPVADANGTATITLTVSDGVDQDTEIFTVTVTAVNDMPTITAVADQGINEDVALAPVGFTIGDLETAPAALIVTAVSSDQSVVADADISLGGSGAGRTIALTPVADANGTATITLTVSDGVDQDTEVFNVAVAAVNDVPTITAVVDQGISEDGALAPVGFTIGDVETAPAALVVTAVSSDQSVIADAGITLGGSGASRTLALTPVADANGTATITLTVSDGVDQDTEIFTVTVTAVNDMPTITAVADQGINEDVALAPVGFTIGDLETAPAALIVTAVSSDQSVVADADISLGGSGAGRTIALTPVADANGTATITLTVSDGVDQDTEVFNVAVAAVNDVPTITAVVDQGISEDGALAPVGFTIGDVETAPAALVVTAVSSDQSVIADAGITLGGSGASRTLALTPVADANGTATITLTVSDGVDQDTEIFTVTVTAVNDMPTITAVADQGINEDVALAPVGFTIGDLETAPAALIVTAVSSDQSVVADADISLGGSGAGRTIALTPVADANGTATITLTVSDGVDQDTEVFNVAVAAVNDVPTITAVVDQGINEDVALAPVGFTIGDLETAPAALIVTAVSSDQSVVADADISLGGSGAGRTIALTPVADANGTATITLTVSDGVDQDTEVFNVAVAAVNDVPTITAVVDQGISEDGALAPVGFTIGDVETAPAALIVTAVSSDQSVIADADITLGGSGASRTIALTPVAEASGSATVTITVSDGVDQDTEIFTVTVTAVNDVPTITAVADQGINEDVALAPVGFTIGDVETAPAALVVTAVSSDQSVIADADITLGGSGASRTLALTPVAEASGSATVTITVSDGVDQDTEIFTVTVTAVNDVPTITAVADQGISEDGTLAPVGFTIGDVETAPAALVVTAVSSDQSVIADADITLGGSGASRTIALTPVADANGTATITLTVSDGVDQDTEIFTVTVTAVNDVPTITAVADQGINEDVALAPVGFTIGDVETAPAALVVTAVSSDQSVIADADITLGGSGASRTLALTPVAEASGSATVTITVSDGVDQDTEIFTVTVTAVNDVPTITAVADQGISEDGTLAPVGFTIGDVETAPAALVVTAVSSDQSVIADADITLGGSGASRTIALTPVADANGTATITLTVSDGVDQDTEIFTVTVTAVNDMPTITAVADQGISEDGALAPVGFTIGDVETAPAALIVTAVSSDQSVIADADITLGGSGASRTIALTPVAEASGSATVTITVSDGVDQDTEIFTVTVTAVNDVPTITAVADQGISEDGALAPVGFTIGDVETAPAALVVTAVSSDQSVIADADITLGGSGASRTLALTPVAEASGSATVTITVSDGVDQDTEIFTVTVTAVNDVPTITAVADQGISEDGALAPVGFTIGDVETAPAALVVTAVSSDQSVIADADITLGGSGASRTLALTPVAEASGSATVTITVSDGVDQDTEIFTVTVTAVNDVPTITAVADQGISEDGALAPVGFTIGDVETAPAALIVTAVSSDQSVIADADITLGGSGASRTIALTPVAEASGSATVTITVSDGVDQDTEIFTVTVTAVNDVPTITAVADQGISEDGTLAPVGFTIGDVETAPAALVVTAVSSDQSVIADADITLGGSGASRTIALTPVADANGTVTITVSVSDGVDAGTEVFDVSVAPVNDPPVIVEQVDNGLYVLDASSLTLTLADLVITDIDSAVPGDMTLTVLAGANYTFVGNDVTPTVSAPASIDVNVRVDDDLGGMSNILPVTIAVVIGAADLESATTVDVPEPLIGQQVTITGTITNNGPDTATNVDVEVLFNVGFSFDSIVSVDGSLGGSTWSIPSIASGTQATIEVLMTVENDGPYFIISEVFSVDQFDPDSIPANDVPSEDDYAILIAAPPGVVEDSDGDGLTDVTEVVLDTKVNDADTDDDHVNDGIEVAAGGDPTDKAEVSERIYVDPDAIGDDDGEKWNDAYTTLALALADPRISSGVPGKPVYVLISETSAATPGGDWQLNLGGGCSDLVFVGSLDGDNDNVVIPVHDADREPTTIFDMAGGPGALIDGCQNLWVHSVRFTDGSGDGVRGGGISVGSGAIVTLKDVLVDSSTAPVEGGGISVTDPVTNVTLQDSTVRDNLASTGDGGGIAVTNGATLHLNGSRVVRNESADFGGGVYVDHADFNADGCNVSGNFATEDGGGIYVQTAGIGANLIFMSNCVISGNEAAKKGGGFAAGASGSDVSLFNDLLVGNLAQNGGAVSLVNNSASLANVSAIYSEATLSLTGGAVFLGSASPVITDSIFWISRNQVTLGESLEQAASTPSLSHNLIEDPGASGTNIDITGVGPAFSSAYYLDQGASPGVDSGSLTASDVGLDLSYTDASGATKDSGTLDRGFHYPDPIIGGAIVVLEDSPGPAPVDDDITLTVGVDDVNQLVLFRITEDGLPLAQGHEVVATLASGSVVDLAAAADVDPLGDGRSVVLADLGDGIFICYADGIALGATTLSVYVNGVLAGNVPVTYAN